MSPDLSVPWAGEPSLKQISPELSVCTENTDTGPHCFWDHFFLLGKVMKLSPKAEEVATFFAKMLDHEYTTKEIFRKNFFKDWRKVCVLIF